jgi:membrane-bound lytic murein transglycosylase B
MRRVVGWFVAMIALSAAVHFLMQVYEQRPVSDLTPTGLSPPAAQPPPLPPPRSAGASGSVPLVDPAWVSRMAARAGLPEPALRAYAAAMLRSADTCDVGWTTLAGIGWVESQHGTIGGRTLGPDGRSSSPILGPALDGSGGFAAIPATAQSTTWHGDPEWDHAVGQMQFIPSTWEQWGADGDGDGAADPNDIDDAAYTAARYLCADGNDLASSAGWSAACSPTTTPTPTWPTCTPPRRCTPSARHAGSHKF